MKNALTGEKDSGTTGSSQEGTSASQSQSTPKAVGSVQEPAAYKDGPIMEPEQDLPEI